MSGPLRASETPLWVVGTPAGTLAVHVDARSTSVGDVKGMVLQKLRTVGAAVPISAFWLSCGSKPMEAARNLADYGVVHAYAALHFHLRLPGGGCGGSKPETPSPSSSALFAGPGAPPKKEQQETGGPVADGEAADGEAGDDNAAAPRVSSSLWSASGYRGAIRPSMVEFDDEDRQVLEDDEMMATRAQNLRAHLVRLAAMPSSLQVCTPAPSSPRLHASTLPPHMHMHMHMHMHISHETCTCTCT